MLPALAGHARIQGRALEEAGHEGQAVPPDEGLAGEDVEHRVGAAADEGQCRRDGARWLPDGVQPAPRDRGLMLGLWFN